MNKRLKVVQIGTAHDHAPMAWRSLCRQSDIFEPVGLVIPDGEPADRIHTDLARLTLDEALAVPDLDAAVIETADKDLTRYATAVANSGLAVHMDKPGGLRLADMEALIATVKKQKSVFHTGYMYRYNPAVCRLLADIRAGKYGEIYSVEAHMDCFHTPAKRAWLGQFPGGMTFYLGCHLIDLILQIMGTPQDITVFNTATGIDGVTADDLGMAVFRYPHGVSYFKACAVEPGGYLRRQLVVCGSKGTVQLMPFEAAAGNDPEEIYTRVREVTDALGDWRNDGVCRDTPAFNRYDPMLRAFAAYVRGEKQNPFSPDYELALYTTILRCCAAPDREEHV